jgi:hypothetical protein
MRLCRPALLCLPTLMLAGCLVPLPLSEQTAADGGQVLMVVGAMPPFGTMQAISITQQQNYSVEVITDSPRVAGRLFIEVNDACCNLTGDYTVIKFSQFGYAMPEDTGSGTLVRYNIQFQQPVQPCTMVPPKVRANVIPVLATEGFPDPTGVGPNGLGIVDNSHFWQISCP